MALLHKATLTPGKRELMVAFLAGQPWAAGVGEVTPVASYRFDDPAGEVGLEATLLGDAAGTILHVPLTYRGAPLEGAEEYLIGTTEHSVLGPRWVYDGCGDPVWNAELAKAILTGGTQAEQYFEVDGEREMREPTMTVQGSGSVPQGDDPAPVDLFVVRVVGGEIEADETLTGRWDDREAVLAGVRGPIGA